MGKYVFGLNNSITTQLFAVSAMLILSAIFAVNVPAQFLENSKGKTSNAGNVRAKDFAFYGTNHSDWAVLTTGTAGMPRTWKILKNPADPAPGAAQIAIFNWGIVGDTITPGSWTGDATYDAGIWRSGLYWISPWEANGSTFTTNSWGTTGDNLGREGDYDGDGIVDPTILRILSSEIFWWMKLSSNGQTRVVSYGRTAAGQSTIAFPGADFTNDGRDEIVLAQVNNSTGALTWFVADAVTGAQLFQADWGNFNTDFAIKPADYTGDGRADLIVWRSGAANANDRVWYILNPFTGTQAQPIGLQFGIGDAMFTNNDIAIRGDYDGDGTHDIAVYRRSNRTFYARASSDGSLIVQQWGDPGDIPLANFFVF